MHALTFLICFVYLGLFSFSCSPLFLFFGEELSLKMRCTEVWIPVLSTLALWLWASHVLHNVPCFINSFLSSKTDTMTHKFWLNTILTQQTWNKSYYNKINTFVSKSFYHLSILFPKLEKSWQMIIGRGCTGLCGYKKTHWPQCELFLYI